MEPVRALIDWMYWVNHRMLEAAADLRDEAWLGTAGATIRDLRATLVHELDTEWSWRLRLREQSGQEWEEELRPEQYPDVASLAEAWRRDEREMRAWLATLSDDDLAAPATSPAITTRLPLWHFLLHIVTHAAQQHADAATLLTQAGASPGDTEFLDYVRERRSEHATQEPPAAS